MAPDRYRLLFELLEGCGLLIGEGIAVQRLHFQLEDGPPEVCVLRAMVRARIGPPNQTRA
jgi:hypothetical protein